MSKINNFIAMIFALILVTGCASFVAPYDKKTESHIMAINTKTHDMLLELETSQGLPEVKYENFKDTYKSIRTDISNLELRASAISKNKLTQEQIVLLTKNLDLLEELHKTGFGGTVYGKSEAVKSAKLTFKQSLTAMLRLEIAKKRGTDTPTEEEV